MKYKDATIAEVNEAMQRSWDAFRIYRKKNLAERSAFLRAIANELKKGSDELISIAAGETNLEEARLKVELMRTIYQLTSYADACEEGTWLDIRINSNRFPLPVKQRDVNIPASKNNEVAKPLSTINKQLPTVSSDLRKMLVPLGPVVVFGASNFPFAYSTAGGDTACALAAGCSVVIKAHPAHAHTSELVSGAIQRAVKQLKFPEAVFIHLHGASFETGKTLVQHPLTKAVGFTGSFEGGKALFDLANQRAVPIPVFAEMGSVNPVFLLPGKLKKDVSEVAAMYAQSITQSAGQFCTNPGILAGIENDVLDEFKKQLGDAIAKVKPAKMLHKGIARNFHQKRKKALKENGVSTIATSELNATEEESIPTLAEVSADIFLKNPLLHQEVFGPFSLLVTCKDPDEMLQVARSLEGQLTCSLMATTEDIKEHSEIAEALQDRCGRFVLNGVPTGVEVALAMHHGGPYPATTDSRFTAVGADGIKRFARPVCFQNWNNELLPDELKNENPLGLWRTVNGELNRI